MSKLKINRNRELNRVRGVLNRDGYPRLEMFLLVSFTGMAGFFASHVLLNFGMNTMWIRYLASIGFAYVIFMLMLWIWLLWKSRNSSDNVDLTADIGNIGDIGLSPSVQQSTSVDLGGGGQFSGGGSSVDFASDASMGEEGVGMVGEAMGAAAQAEEAAIPLMVIIALLAALFSVFLVAFSLVYSAPILFSELLVDGMLSASLYRRLSGIDSHHWLESALKRTIWPFVFAAVIFAVVGWAMAYFVPGTHSLGEIVSMLLANK